MGAPLTLDIITTAKGMVLYGRGKQPPRKTMKLVRAMLVSAIAFRCGPVCAQVPEHSVSQVVKATVDSVVLVVVSDQSGKVLAQGSGFIVTPDGKVVTNHHVIVGAYAAVVKLNNGSFFPVEGVTADDAEHDIAILKVSGKGLPFLNLSDSDALAVGDHVVAIGSPLGLENSVSDGIISGFRYESGKRWIQTTAPVSHGNSGGPLLTMDERVAGLITWKAAAGENLNFAVPSTFVALMLSNSDVHPLANSKPDSTPAVASEDRVWTSMTTGHDYKIRMDGDHVYTQRINFPVSLQSTAAFVRADLI
jgi:S1-C subfamily serine protease